jgi:hypothetical protein
LRDPHREEIQMNLNGIDATLNQLVQQLPKGLGQREVKETFEALIESLRNQIQSAIDEAASGKTPAVNTMPASAPAPATATPAVPASSAHAPSATRSTAALSAYQRSWLKNAEGPLFDPLSNDLTSASPLYNEREVILREALDLGAIENHLRKVAESYEIEFHKSDLEGILRNSGYGAAHLGSTERYMSAVQKFISEAENNYRQRASNVPGSGSNA